MSIQTRRIAGLLAAAALLGASFSLSAQTGEAPAGEPAEPLRTQAQLTLNDLRAFTDVFNQVRRNYVGEVTDKELLDAAIRGMLSELDPHSDYLPATEYEDLEDNSRGRYSGIGIDVQPEEGRIVVNAVINGSPADQAGINPGDLILAIDGQPIRGRRIPEAIDQLTGDPGTRLELTVQTPGDEPRQIRLERKYLQIPALSFELLDKDYGYFRITYFHHETAEQLEKALESVTAEGTVLRGLVIDLRNNPGGVLQPAVTLADGFLDEGMIVSTRGQNESMQLQFEARPGQWLPDTPLILLVDRGSASASEVLAGALQDHGRALIVGERTFGKGTVQTVLPLRNGSGIKLTTALYYTPSGRSIQAEGIQPDIVLDGPNGGHGSDSRIREADLERHLDANTVQGAPAGESRQAHFQDFPVEEALQVLRSADILPAEDGEAPVESEEEGP
ncbi:MAG: S41 family peptidase [Xanthomonadales bacterium]|nr:S41 family peptidase [Xanthomonadales bacterium]